MALVFRAAFLGRGLRICAPKCNSLKISLKHLSHAQNEYTCKALFTLSSVSRRDYSTISNAENKIITKSKDAEAAPAVLKKTADGKEIVHEGLLALKIRNIKFVSLTTSFIALSAQPMFYMKAVINGTANSWTIPAFGVIAAFALATPLLLHYVSKRYVLRVCYDSVKDKYIATVYNIFVIEKNIEFTPEDVTIPTVLGMFTSCAIKGKPMFMDPEDFPDQKHYVRIMGYDKPLDLGFTKKEIKKAKLKKKVSSSDV